MELTEKDRLFLYNQFEILRVLNIENGNEAKRYEKYQQILEYGYEQLYGVVTDGFKDTINKSVTNFVYDVLDMYSKILFSYLHLSVEDKNQIEIDDIKGFDGFDGNYETDYKKFTEFVFEYEEAYTEIKEYCVTDSHAKRLGYYSRMLEIYNNLEFKDYLTLEQIKQVLN